MLQVDTMNSSLNARASHWLLWYTQLWDAQYSTGSATLKRMLLRVGEDLPALRGELLGEFGLAVSGAGNYEEGAACVDEGVRLAERCADDRLLGRVLSGLALQRYLFFECRQAARAVERVVEKVGALPDMRWTVASSAWIRLYALSWLGRLDEVRASLDEYQTEAERLGHVGATWCLKHLRGMVAYMDGEFDRSLQHFEDAAAFARARQIPMLFHTSYNSSTVLHCIGRHEEAIVRAREALQLERRRPRQPYGLFLRSSPDSAARGR